MYGKSAGSIVALIGILMGYDGDNCARMEVIAVHQQFYVENWDRRAVLCCKSFCQNPHKDGYSTSCFRYEPKTCDLSSKMRPKSTFCGAFSKTARYGHTFQAGKFERLDDDDAWGLSRWTWLWVFGVSQSLEKWCFFSKNRALFSLLQAEMRMVKVGEAASVTTGSPLRFQAVNIWTLHFKARKVRVLCQSVAAMVAKALTLNMLSKGNRDSHLTSPKIPS